MNNPDYTFLSLHYEAVQDYLGLLGWDLRKDKPTACVLKRKDSLWIPRKRLIIIKGKDQTDSVASFRFHDGRCEVVYTSAPNKTYDFQSGNG